MQNRKPAWWQLYLLVPIMGVLLLLEFLEPLPGVSPQLVFAGIVVLIFGAMLVWVHLNGGLLERYDADKGEPSQELKVTVYEPASKRESDGNGSDESRSVALPRLEGRVRGKKPIRLKEKDKWFLN